MRMLSRYTLNAHVAVASPPAKSASGPTECVQLFRASFWDLGARHPKSASMLRSALKLWPVRCMLLHSNLIPFVHACAA